MSSTGWLLESSGEYVLTGEYYQGKEVVDERCLVCAPHSYPVSQRFERRIHEGGWRTSILSYYWYVYAPVARNVQIYQSAHCDDKYMYSVMDTEPRGSKTHWGFKSLSDAEQFAFNLLFAYTNGYRVINDRAIDWLVKDEEDTENGTEDT